MLVLLGLLGVTDWLELPHHWLSYLGNPGWNAWIIQAGIVTVLAVVGIWLFCKTYLELRILEGLLHMCAGCRKIRVSGEWQPIETYLMEHTHAQVSHGFYQECLERLYPEVMESLRKESREDTPEAAQINHAVSLPVMPI